MDQNKKLRLEWFLDFINLNTEDLSQSERQKWIAEALYMLEFGEPHVKLRKYPIKEIRSSPQKIIKWDEGEELERCSELLKGFLEKLWAKIEETLEEKSAWMPRDKFEFGNHFVNFETNVKAMIQAPVASGLKTKIKNENKKNETWYHKINQEEMLDAPLHLSLYSADEAKSLLLTFCQNLNGVKIGFVRKCNECDKWFLHTTKKEKIYCTNRCAARKASRERRERIKTDPKKHAAELKNAADRARRSYVKSVDRGSPARRPYKYKDSKEK